MCKTTRWTTWIPASMVLLACSYGQTVVWVPDYVDEKVQVRIGEDPGTKSVTLKLAQCNPNSVAVNSGKLYVICNGEWDNGDKVLVYDAAAIKAAADASELMDGPLQTITSPEFNKLIGIAFDAQNNLWVASWGNNKILSISAATLNANPVVEVSLVNSPAQPAGLAFDPDGSLWVTGGFNGGILVNIAPDNLHAGDVPTRYCIASEVDPACQLFPNRFKNPEGVALFHDKIWVANNGGGMPGRELVGLHVENPGKPSATLVVDFVFGPPLPFVCPGGLFASSQYLWMNDEGYGAANTTCGQYDRGTGVGGIFRFEEPQMGIDPATSLRFLNITGRPGFGGLFVEENP